MSRYAAAIVLGVFIFVTLFGLPTLLAHTDNHVGCPLQGAQTVMCESTILEHFSQWQSMFVSILSLFALLLGFACVMTREVRLALAADKRVAVRTLSRLSTRQTVLQELFARGILNRKEPYTFS